jgi:hypothetical protein
MRNLLLVLFMVQVVYNVSPKGETAHPVQKRIYTYE